MINQKLVLKLENKHFFAHSSSELSWQYWLKGIQLHIHTIRVIQGEVGGPGLPGLDGLDGDTGPPGPPVS